MMKLMLSFLLRNKNNFLTECSRSPFYSISRAHRATVCARLRTLFRDARAFLRENPLSPRSPSPRDGSKAEKKNERKRLVVDIHLNSQKRMCRPGQSPRALVEKPRNLRKFLDRSVFCDAFRDGDVRRARRVFPRVYAKRSVASFVQYE